MLSTDVGQSAHLRTVSPANLHQIFTDLRISSATALDPATIRRVADFSNADRVVWGQYARFGDQIRIDATLLDIKSGAHGAVEDRCPQRKRYSGRGRPPGGVHPSETGAAGKRAEGIESQFLSTEFEID